MMSRLLYSMEVEPVASPMRRWTADATPALSSLERASALEFESSATRIARWTGRRVKSTPRARMALMQTPTPAELSPILPMIPASVIMLIEGKESRLMFRWMRFACCGSSH